jgi:MerR family transcriptional regulator, light-induced transcriptional regulator
MSEAAGRSSDERTAASAATLSRTYLEALRAADRAGAYAVVSRALRDGMTTAALYRDVVAPALHGIGELWERGAITVADEHLATALTHEVLASIRPPIRVDAGAGGEARSRSRAILAAVEGEQHALGARMAADVLEDCGCETLYLGGDVPTEALLQAVAALSPDLVGLSATMPDAAPRLEDAAAAVRRDNPQLPLFLGGQAAALCRPGEWVVVEDLERLPAVLDGG